jgi:hypothetical protein
MNSRKKTVAKPSAKITTATRPPRQVWLVLDESGADHCMAPTRTEATKLATSWGRVVGPYVLAERVRER